MSWFDRIKTALPQHYTGAHAADIVGYLQGSADPHHWRAMAQTGSGQMIVLGNAPPTLAEWQAAGVAHRNQPATIRLADLAGLIVIYGGFMVTRPWGHIVIPDDDTNAYFQNYIDSWQRNDPGRRRR